MATPFDISHTWQVDRSVVLEHHLDPGLPERINDALHGVERRRVAVEERDGKTVQRFQVRSTEVPAAARKVLKPDMLDWVEESVWDPAAETFEWRILPNAMKGKIEAGGKLWYEDLDGRTRRRVSGTIAIHIPLVGRTIEKVLVHQIERTYDQSSAVEQAFFQEKAGG